MQISPSAAVDVSPTAFTREEFIHESDPPDTRRVRLTYDYPAFACGATPPANCLNVKQDYFLIEPVDTNHNADLEPELPAKAVLVLFTGGGGTLGLGDNQISLRTANFVVRQRWAFAAAGPYIVAVIDASRFWIDISAGGNLRGKRITNKHMVDVANVVQDLKNNFGLPIWLVGTSRGTISAAAAAARLANIGPANDDGLVLTATLTNDADPDEEVFDVPLHLIDVPTLIASHEDDSCSTTPPEDGALLAAALTGAPKVKLEKLFKGGLAAISDACSALSPHGFFGIEAKVIKKIARFINGWI
jgi:pimeloyl-ACP methyl ester carboxylesterase